MPGSALTIVSNWALIALTAGSSGSQVLGLDRGQGAGQRGEILRGLLEVPADLDQRAGEDGDHDHREHDAEDDQGGLAHPAPFPLP